jgi:hypothetical protein
MTLLIVARNHHVHFGRPVIETLGPVLFISHYFFGTAKMKVKRESKLQLTDFFSFQSKSGLTHFTPQFA